ncbi:nitroreductase family protein [Chloroflexota bacterium]
MEIPASRWYSVIEKRRSRRSFEARPLESNHLMHIRSICNDFSPFSDSHSVLVTEPPDKVFKGAIGPYGKIRGAPAFIAFIGNMENPNVQEQVGYMGEGIILEVEAMDLGTCWVALFNSKIVGSLTILEKHEQVLAIAAIGYVKNQESIEERLVTGFGWTHKRKPLSHLVTGLDEVEYPQWIRAALEVARLAPSAANRQPWRFYVDSGSIAISVNSLRRNFGVSRRLDCGIAMLHIEVAALNSGIDGNWEFLEQPYVAKYAAKTKVRLRGE